MRFIVLLSAYFLKNPIFDWSHLVIFHPVFDCDIPRAIIFIFKGMLVRFRQFESEQFYITEGWLLV